MKKMVFFTLCFASSLALAQTPKEVLNQLDQVQSQTQKTQAPCPSCDLAQAGAYSPQEALADMKAGNLKFLGRDLFPGSDQNRTCVFKTDKAYILYYNCMASKKEAPATEIEVISFNGGIVRYYVENYKDLGPISKMDRSQYDGTWSVTYVPSSAPGDLNLAQLKEYKQKFSPNKGACWIGKTGGAKDMSSKASCYGTAASDLSSWGSSAESFWFNPGKEWPETHQQLRKTVESAKY